jgi:hypothetical protein
MTQLLSRALTFIAAFAWALASQLASPALAEPVNDNPWVALAPIPEPAGLEGHCTSLIGNKIYTGFGFTPTSGDTNRLRIYDIATNTWVFGPPAPTAGRSEHYRGVAKGGRLYCLGGRTTNETWSFDTVTMTWSMKAPFPDANHVGTTAATFGNSIFVFGGRVGASPCSSPGTSAVRRYDVDQDAWFPAGNMANARSDTTVARVGGFIYIFGGCNGATSFESTEKYDPRTGTSVIVNMTMPGGPRADAAAGDPQNGSSANAAHRIHVTGGFNNAGVGPPTTLNHLIYDVDENAFFVGVPMPTHCAPGVNRAEHELVHGKDKIIALGGACPAFGTSLFHVDMQKLSDPPAPSASITAYSCNENTFPSCDLQPLGASGVFVTGTGFAPLSTVQMTSSTQGPVPPTVTDVQGDLTAVYVDTSCDGQSRTITAVDGAGNTASTTFNCP